MGLKCGIVGLPNVGKSTIFNALSSAKAESANYPFCTIEPNTGIAALPDPRLDLIAKLAESKQVVPAVVEFVDIAGLVKGASKGEGLGNQFLAHIREVDAIVHVVRCFEDEDVVHVHGEVDPVSDIEVVETELMLSDLAAVEKRLARLSKLTRIGDKSAVKEVEALTLAQKHLSEGRRLVQCQGFDVSDTELNLLTSKPCLFVANISEDKISGFEDNPAFQALSKAVKERNGEVIALSGQVEAEISALTPSEREEFLSEVGLSESGLGRLVRSAFRLLKLITFFTAGPKEARAWTCKLGALAPQAAGVIHSDFERGFIRAEVIAYDDYIACKGESGAKSAGKLRVEGKDYQLVDGDVVHFRFNV